MIAIALASAAGLAMAPAALGQYQDRGYRGDDRGTSWDNWRADRDRATDQPGRGYYTVYDEGWFRDRPAGEVNRRFTEPNWRYGYYDPQEQRGYPMYKWDEDQRTWVPVDEDESGWLSRRTTRRDTTRDDDRRLGTRRDDRERDRQGGYWGVYEQDVMRDDPARRGGDAVSDPDWRYGYYDPQERSGQATHEWDEDRQMWAPVDRDDRGWYDRRTTRRDDDRWFGARRTDRDMDRRGGYWGVYEEDVGRDDPAHRGGDTMSSPDWRYGFYDPQERTGYPTHEWDDDRQMWVPVDRDSRRARDDRWDWGWGDERDRTDTRARPRQGYYTVYDEGWWRDRPAGEVSRRFTEPNWRYGYYDPQEQRGYPIYKWDDDRRTWVPVDEDEDRGWFDRRTTRRDDRDTRGDRLLGTYPYDDRYQPRSGTTYDQERQRMRDDRYDAQRYESGYRPQPNTMDDWYGDRPQQRNQQFERQRMDQQRSGQQGQFQQGQQGARRVQLSGTVSNVQRANLRDQGMRMGQSNIVRIELENGRTALVDLGPQTSLQDLNLSRNSEIQVSGRQQTFQGQQVLQAEQVRIDGREVNLRGGQRQQSRFQNQR